MKIFILLVLVASAYANISSEYAGYVRQSWDQVKKSEVEILYYVFKHNPDIQAKFPMFAGKELDSLKNTAPFALHATRIV
jgi:Globin